MCKQGNKEDKISLIVVTIHSVLYCCIMMKKFEKMIKKKEIQQCSLKC